MFDHYLVIDLEATCSDDDAVPREEMEIIEIGAVMATRDSFAPVGEFQTFIRPVVHRQLTPFCTELTSITQADVDGAPGFVEALGALTDWAAAFEPYRFASWGAYDRGQFESDCRRHGLPYPFPEPHLNLKAEFSKNQGVRRRFGMKTALTAANLELTGRHHRGIDDARNIVRLLPFVFGEARIDTSRVQRRRR